MRLTPHYGHTLWSFLAVTSPRNVHNHPKVHILRPERHSLTIELMYSRYGTNDGVILYPPEDVVGGGLQPGIVGSHHFTDSAWVPHYDTWRVGHFVPH
jgi:hypothetical protein